MENLFNIPEFNDYLKKNKYMSKESILNETDSKINTILINFIEEYFIKNNKKLSQTMDYRQRLNNTFNKYRQDSENENENEDIINSHEKLYYNKKISSCFDNITYTLYSLNHEIINENIEKYNIPFTFVQHNKPTREINELKKEVKIRCEECLKNMNFKYNNEDKRKLSICKAYSNYRLDSFIHNFDISNKEKVCFNENLTKKMNYYQVDYRENKENHMNIQKKYNIELSYNPFEDVRIYSKLNTVNIHESNTEKQEENRNKLNLVIKKEKYKSKLQFPSKKSVFISLDNKNMNMSILTKNNERFLMIEKEFDNKKLKKDDKSHSIFDNKPGKSRKSTLKIKKNSMIVVNKINEVIVYDDKQEERVNFIWFVNDLSVFYSIQKDYILYIKGEDCHLIWKMLVKIIENENLKEENKKMKSYIYNLNNLLNKVQL